MIVSYQKIQFVFMAIAALAITGCDGEPAKFTPSVKVMHSISGMVSGASVSGVTIALTGAAVKTAVTDSMGAYVISGAADGSYTVTPILAGYIFTPASLVVTVAGSDLANANFLAVPTDYEISGTVVGAVRQGVTMTLTGGTNAVTTTDEGGNYKFTNVVDESFIVTPTLDGYLFVPKSATATYYGMNASIINFAAVPLVSPIFSISGTVSGAVQQGVRIVLTGATCGEAMTDVSGNYLFDGLTAGAYTILPIPECAISDPSVSDVTITAANVSDVNFTLTSSSCYGSIRIAKQIMISGTVSGVVQQGVTMILTGRNCALATTDANGQYTFIQYLSGVGNYTVTPTVVGYTFSPTSTPITISTSDLSGIDFTSQ